MDDMASNQKNQIPKPLIPNSCDPSIPSNDCNPTWTVNLKYITAADLTTFYGYVPELDETPDNPQLTDNTEMAISFASERINTLTGNKIESIGLINLNLTQQQLVKRATARLTIYYLKNDMDFLRSSVSISGNGLASSISPPSDPDYIPNEVYNLLQQANLYIPRKGLSLNICSKCNQSNCICNFNQSSIWDQSDCRLITWDSALKTFLQKLSLNAGTGINIQDISDTIPKLLISSINVTSPILQRLKLGSNNQITYITTPTIFDNSNDIPNRDYVDLKQNITDNTFNTSSKTVPGAINELLTDINTKQNTIAVTGPITLTGGNNIGLQAHSTFFTTDANGLEIIDSNSSQLASDLLSTNTYNTLNTTSQTIVGALNEVKGVNDTQDTNIATNTSNIALKQDILISGTNIKTVATRSLLGSGDINLVKADINLGNVDNTSDLNKPISIATQSALNNKQDTLISGTNIKTINSNNILGSGNILVQGILNNGTYVSVISNTVDITNTQLGLIGTQVNTIQNNYSLATTSQTIKGAIGELLTDINTNTTNINNLQTQVNNLTIVQNAYLTYHQISVLILGVATSVIKCKLSFKKGNNIYNMGSINSTLIDTQTATVALFGTTWHSYLSSASSTTLSTNITATITNGTKTLQSIDCISMSFPNTTTLLLTFRDNSTTPATISFDISSLS